MALHNNVFKQQIWEFFCDDIESCLEVSRIKQLGQNSNFKGGLNFTAAIIIFSVIDFCAAFYKGHEATGTEKAEFLNKYLAKYHKPFSDLIFCKKFYNIFRNGLSHQWSPKASGIAMDFNTKDIIRVQNGNNREPIPILNIPPFFDLIKKAFANYESDLNLSHSLQEKFEKRYNELIKNDYRQMRQLRDLIA